MVSVCRRADDMLKERNSESESLHLDDVIIVHNGRVLAAPGDGTAANDADLLEEGNY